MFIRSSVLVVASMFEESNNYWQRLFEQKIFNGQSHEATPKALKFCSVFVQYMGEDLNPFILLENTSIVAPR